MEKSQSKQKDANEEIVKNQKYKSSTINTLLNPKENLKEKSEIKNNEKNNKSNNTNSKSELKDDNAIKLSDIINNIKNMPTELLEKEIENIKSDISNFKIKVGIDKDAIKILDELENDENKEQIKKILASFTQSMSIDINSISELSSEQLKSVRNYCKVDRVYVNSGWDESAKKGYEVEKYAKIRSNADKMLNKALKNLPQNASQEQKFMAIYNAVLKAERYDYQALNTSSPDYQRRRITSRNLEGFFLNKRSVCAGTADALKQLCECAGFEAEYVQGYAQSEIEKRNNKRPSYHAWMKVKIGNKWYNADPTWDANHAGKPYEYCLKSDREFKNHNEDRAYNPTYKRNFVEQYRSSGTRRYKTSTESIDTSLIRKYYNNNLYEERANAIQLEEAVLTDEEQKALHYEMTDKDREILKKDYAPYMEKAVMKLSLKQKIANYLSKKGFLSKIFKKFIEKNKVDVNSKDMTKQNKENKSELNEYRVAPEKAKYKIEEKAVSEKVEEKEQNVK